MGKTKEVVEVADAPEIDADFEEQLAESIAEADRGEFHSEEEVMSDVRAILGLQ